MGAFDTAADTKPKADTSAWQRHKDGPRLRNALRVLARHRYEEETVAWRFDGKRVALLGKGPVRSAVGSYPAEAIACSFHEAPAATVERARAAGWAPNGDEADNTQALLKNYRVICGGAR